MTERELVKNAQAGSKEAFAQLYVKYQTKLYRYAYYKLGNADDAEDAVSDAVVSAFVQIKELKRADAFSSWLFKILSASCSKYIKHQIAKRDSVDVDTLVYVSGNEKIPDGTLTDLQRALNLLSLEDRDIVLLSAVAGLKSKEIAKIIGLSSNNVRVRLSRALAKMRDFLE